MTKQVNTTYVCDICKAKAESTGAVTAGNIESQPEYLITDEKNALEVTLQSAHRMGVMKPGSTGEKRTGTEAIHAHRGNYDIQAPKGAGLRGVTAYVTESGSIAMFEVQIGKQKRYYGGDDMPVGWQSLADEIEATLLV